MAEKNVHEASAAASAVGVFLLKRKSYGGRERIMAADGFELKTSDLEKLVAFVHSCKREVAAMNHIGGVSPLLYNDPAWLANNEKLVERHATEWKEVTPDESAR